jgi:hypothetical protein
MGPVLLALPARSYCPRHKRLLVGWNGEGECRRKIEMSPVCQFAPGGSWGRLGSPVGHCGADRKVAEVPIGAVVYE